MVKIIHVCELRSFQDFQLAHIEAEYVHCIICLFIYLNQRIKLMQSPTAIYFYDALHNYIVLSIYVPTTTTDAEEDVELGLQTTRS